LLSIDDLINHRVNLITVIAHFSVRTRPKDLTAILSTQKYLKGKYRNIVRRNWTWGTVPDLRWCYVLWQSKQ